MLFNLNPPLIRSDSLVLLEEWAKHVILPQLPNIARSRQSSGGWPGLLTISASPHSYSSHHHHHHVISPPTNIMMGTVMFTMMITMVVLEGCQSHLGFKSSVDLQIEGGNQEGPTNMAETQHQWL